MAESMSRLSLLKNTFLLLLSTVSAAFLIQDIVQDVLVMSSALHSPRIYYVLYDFKIKERAFGFLMAISFSLSIIVVGFDCMKQGKSLILCQRHPWIIIPLALACLFNLGPVFFIFVKVVISKGKAQRLYKANHEAEQDLHVVENALASSKIKEALCENLPMLIIVSFKTALSFEVSLLEVISSLSSACLLSKVIINSIIQQHSQPTRTVKKIAYSVVLGIFIRFTINMITMFSIEAERDGILVSNDPTLGSEDFSGLYMILLAVPTVFFCALPFSIYDLIPYIFHNSSAVWEHFQGHPNMRWYASVVICNAALFFNIFTTLYFFRRDSLSINSEILTNPFVKSSQCGNFDSNLLHIFQCELKLKSGIGRIYFKGFLILGGVTSVVVYLWLMKYILGMRHRDRSCFKEGLKKCVDKEMASVLKDLQRKATVHDLVKEYNMLQVDQVDMASNTEVKQAGKVLFSQ